MTKLLTPNRIALAPLAALVALLAGCTDEEPLPVAPPSASHGAGHTISGHVLGPDGSSICNFLPSESTVLVHVLIPTPPPFFAGSEDLVCPDDSFSVLVDLGTYRLRVQLPSDPAIGALPWRHLQPGDVVVNGGDITMDVRVLEGSPMGGSVTLDGLPLEGIDPVLVYEDAPRFGQA